MCIRDRCARAPVHAVAGAELYPVDDVPVLVGDHRSHRVAPQQLRQALEDVGTWQRLPGDRLGGQDEPQCHLVRLGEKNVAHGRLPVSPPFHASQADPTVGMGRSSHLDMVILVSEIV